MEKEFDNGNFVPEMHADDELSAEIAQTTIEELVQIVPHELMNVSLNIAEILKTNSEDKTELQSLWTEWSDLVEAYVDSIEHAKLRAEAQIATFINKAFIFQLAGNTVHYLEELDDAAVYAANEGFEAVASSLALEIDNAVEALDLSPEKVVLKLRGIVEDANREYLKELIRNEADLEDIIGATYGIIIEEGGNPDVVLAGLGITE